MRALVTFAVFLWPCFGQAGRAELFGTIQDPSDLAVWKAKVQAEEQATMARFTAASDERGEYHLLGLPPGEYLLTVEQPGFRTYRQSGITLRIADRAVYARGVLALWIPPRSAARVGRLEDLASPEVRVIAIAKPELAPYGQAAVDSLERLGIWERVRLKVVFAENINMAKQYGASNNADAVLTAYSLVLDEAGKVIRVDDKLHRPIDQELGIVAKSEHPDAARKFVAFLLGEEGKKMLAAYGYAAH